MERREAHQAQLADFFSLRESFRREAEVCCLEVWTALRTSFIWHCLGDRKDDQGLRSAEEMPIAPV